MAARKIHTNIHSAFRFIFQVNRRNSVSSIWCMLYQELPLLNVISQEMQNRATAVSDLQFASDE